MQGSHEPRSARHRREHHLSMARWDLDGREIMTRVGYIRDSDLNYMALVILDEESGDTMEIQKSLSFDEQDRALGMDTYCIVRDGSSHYGGLEAWRIVDGSLSLTLTEGAAATLELPSEFEIPIDEDGRLLVVENLGN